MAATGPSNTDTKRRDYSLNIANLPIPERIGTHLRKTFCSAVHREYLATITGRLFAIA
jgi:hypothetical protein